MPIVKTFTNGEISYQLERILNFSVFRNSPTLTRFLEFIVTETIRGAGIMIKEYCIAIQVLKKSKGFNTNEDALVRIHAGRLRKALDRYYITEGIHDPIRIQIPKGCYIPKFYSGNTTKSYGAKVRTLTMQNKKATIAIFPLRSSLSNKDSNEFILALAEQFSTRLSCFQDISVVSYFSTDMLKEIAKNTLEAGLIIGADYVIEGNLQSHEPDTHVQINCVTTTTGEVLATKSFEKNILSGNFFEIQDEIVQAFIAALLNRGSIFPALDNSRHVHYRNAS